jgi:hypothetical protein
MDRPDTFDIPPVVLDIEPRIEPEDRLYGGLVLALAGGLLTFAGLMFMHAAAALLEVV